VTRGSVDRALQVADRREEPTPARPAGLLKKLVAAVRPEFRLDILAFGSGDPVFGGQPCRVAGCERTGRIQGLCFGHDRRWRLQDKPDLDSFIAATDPRMKGRQALAPCRAPGCRHGRKQRGLCTRHLYAWQQAEQPDLDPWLDTLISMDRPGPIPATCRIANCDLWVHAALPLCLVHSLRWKKHGRPDIEEYSRSREDDSVPGHECIDLRGLSVHPRLEMQYAVQCRRDDGQIKIAPGAVQTVINFVAGTGIVSLLDRTEDVWLDAWKDRFPRRARPSQGDSSRALLIYARRRIEDLQYGRGWDVEYPRDIWRLRNLGISEGPGSVRFDGIAQPWLKDPAKRWARWRLSSGLGAGSVVKGAVAITRFSEFLASPAVNVNRLAQVNRALLERYLADLHVELTGRKVHGERISQLHSFLQAVRRHGWDDSLPQNAMFFTEDYPKRGQQLPRALAELVMTQLEHPDNLDRWNDPVRRLITIILMRCGLRLGDALRLPHDCTIQGSDSAPYLRYYNHKMKREALVPIDEELAHEIGEQQLRIRGHWPKGTPVLFPRSRANPDGSKPASHSGYRHALDQWLQRCDIRDEHGQPIRLVPHQWRHTLGTRLINQDVPQEVVRKLLDHDSHAMTAHYARLSDTTVRRHWEQARKVNISGDTVTLDPDGQLAEAAWAKQRLSRATQALPNGYCGLPLVQSCPHANSCLTCPMFLTTNEFLPQHRQHHQQTLQIISKAEAGGQIRMVEMNRRVADNLKKIITALEADEDEQRVADAS
jgi:site-specific recombinase XerD